MVGFVLGTGSGVVAAAAVYYTLSTHLSRDTEALRAELDRTSHLLGTSFNPSTPSAPVASIGPSRDPFEPTFGDQLRLKWNRAIGSGVDGLRETDWAAVGAGVVQGGKDIVGRISGETPSVNAAARHAEDAASTAKDKIHHAETTLSERASQTLDSAKEGLTTAERAVSTSSVSIADRLSSVFSGAKERTDAAVADVQRTAQNVQHRASDLAGDVKDKVHQAAHAVEDAGQRVKEGVKQEVREAKAAKEARQEEYHEGILHGASGPGVTSAKGVDLNKESFTGGSALGVRARRAAEGSVARLV